jgi:class III poly(R)-hydroxyalkanoic acid synthase PhaE subunit
MDWWKQGEGMLNNWMDAQKQMWEGWAKTAAGATNPFAETMYKQWQETVQQGLRGSTFGGGATAQKAAEQMMDAQRAMIDFWQQSASIWQQMMEGGAEQQDWSQMFARFAEQIGKQWTPVTAPEDWKALWEQYQKQWQTLAEPWMRAWQQSPMAELMGKSVDGQEFGKLYWDVYRKTVGQWLDSPNLGLAREFNHKVDGSFKAWMALLEAQAKYQSVLAQVWGEAFQAFLQRVAEKAQAGEKVGSLREWMLLWTATGDEIFGKAFAQDRYVDAQAELVNANMAYRAEARKVMEVLLQIADMPTRGEVDEAHRRIYELRKEVKALKKQMSKMKKAS